MNSYFASVFTIEDARNIPVIAVNQDVEGKEELGGITRETGTEQTDGTAAWKVFGVLMDFFIGS